MGGTESYHSDTRKMFDSGWQPLTKQKQMLAGLGRTELKKEEAAKEVTWSS